MLVKKSDGSFRLVADLRKLNSKTIPDNFPLPHLNEMMDMLSGAKFFTTMDLTSGFHQMVMHPDHAHLTGIATEFGLFEYKRLPFSLKNAGSTFQRLMSIVLAGLNGLKVACYIDDIIIATKTFEEHMLRLEIVFQRLQQANLKVKPTKCSFLQHQIIYLGHAVREGQVLPDEKNLDSIRKVLPPQTRKQVRSFLRLTGVYRKCIPNYSKLALPLTHLTKDKSLFTWAEKEQEDFDALKKHLTSSPWLSLLDFERPSAIWTDASKYSLGVVLVQDDGSGFQNPITFGSRKLGPTEVKFSVFEKEALLIVFGINHFKNYLYGTQFTVYCDQQCLSKLTKLKDPTSRIARRLLTLQQYSYTIVHKPGRLNLMADYISRATNSSDNKVSTNIQEVHALELQFNTFNLNSMPVSEIIAKQTQDFFNKNIKAKLHNNFVFSKN
ncbi:Retrovirus-related Pol polyprotein from transposon 17.6 [Araneus ventricosus]|uniref:RNA-directed DNA polymerase n=1 Tax=Araneus ventricosus TaxID=182803 RepID=A0A4Y2IA04_ARAVE|nr:Retrovirus-related Pol polyprotein from transposon 17.6 [Araneus ventricosus]